MTHMERYMLHLKNNGYTPINSRELVTKARELCSDMGVAVRVARVATKFVEFDVSVEKGKLDSVVEKLNPIGKLDQRFFKTLLNNIDTSKVSIVISADHSTQCINKGHSDDPVPLLVSKDSIKKDQAKRMTEAEAKKGNIGLIEGVQVVKTALDLIKSEI